MGGHFTQLVNVFKTVVDILVEAVTKLVPIEVKLSATPRSKMASALKTFQKDFGDKVMGGCVVHPGDIARSLGSGITALPFCEL